MNVVSKVQEDFWVVLRCVRVTLIISGQVSQPGCVVSFSMFCCSSAGVLFF